MMSRFLASPRLKLIAAVALMAAGSSPALSADTSKYRLELANTEHRFCDQVATVGLDDAYLANLSDECFLPDRLTLTREEFAAQVKKARDKAGAAFKPGPDPDFSLTWAPSKVDVSEDGTLGYTWGRYVLTTHGKDGKDTVDSGLYLTIWKRDAAGTWKIAFDGSPELPTNAEAVKKFLARGDMPQAPKG